MKLSSFLSPTLAPMALLSLSVLTACGGSKSPAADTTAPQLTLNGDATFTLEVGSSYTEEGAVASDNIDTALTATATGSVNVDAVGSYTITYSVSDAAGNAATTVTRTVNIVDTTAPIITLIGDAVMDVNYGSVYSDAGANAEDSVDGAVDVTVTGSVSNELGSYTLTYTASDTAGNAATAIERIVHVVDVTPPVITLVGESAVTLPLDRTYKELGATALDNRDGQSTVTDISSNLDNATLGEYTVTYSITDAAGNTATLNRTVTVAEARPFITTWKTTTVNETITIGTLTAEKETSGFPQDDDKPEASFTYNYTIDWGDGTVEYNQAGDASHEYADAGIHEIEISGQFPGLYSLYRTDNREKIMSVEQWGDIEWQTFYRSFYGALHMTSNAVDDPDLSQVTTMRGAFRYTRGFDHDITDWDVSNVKDFAHMFREHDTFNQDISGWDISGAESMEYMFYKAPLFNRDLSAWDISGVKNIDGLFGYASSFDQDLSGWDYSSVLILDNFVIGSGILVSNYDKLLIKLSETVTLEEILFENDNFFYSLDAKAAHDKLDIELKWIMYDQVLPTP